MFGSACKHNEEQYPNISVESMEGTHGYGDVREREIFPFVPCLLV